MSTLTLIGCILGPLVVYLLIGFGIAKVLAMHVWTMVSKNRGDERASFLMRSFFLVTAWPVYAPSVLMAKSLLGGVDERRTSISTRIYTAHKEADQLLRSMTKETDPTVKEIFRNAWMAKLDLARELEQ